ncbi:PD40 domain-containing protein [Desulfitibacter alkalitolerans]|uniref:PD40 domain-containing protein n=1 Tax=Desulfitibacter alkalitolerans TaxID=264641 RepID=UPI0004814CCB|nr:PD40 domain-containing protein [Desulfitibacter alkalitolerans]
MKNCKYVFLFIIILIALFAVSNVGALDVALDKIFDNRLQGFEHGVLIEYDGRFVSDGYVLKDGNIEKLKTQTKSITIENGYGDRYTFDFMKFSMEDKVVSVKPTVEGGSHNLIVGENIIVFTDQAETGLWVADINTLDAKNIQPDKVNNLSLTDLLNKKIELEEKGEVPIGTFSWIYNPVLSPNEDTIAFISNRNGFPDNLHLTLWITDINGNTKEVVDESDNNSVAPIMWVNNDELVYLAYNPIDELKIVNIRTGEKKHLMMLGTEFSFNSAPAKGQYLLYSPIKGASLVHENYIYNVVTQKSFSLLMPEGYKNEGLHVWNEAGNKIAYYIRSSEGSRKLLVADCATAKTVIYEPPTGTEFEHIPSWSNDTVVFSANGKLYSTK